MSRKNRVQPADSLQAKSVVLRAIMGGELVAVPIFRSRATLCHELLAHDFVALARR